jgi:signal-transduction protein with cAMP-binding, CBS, and nucleotidyltransferase domain
MLRARSIIEASTHVLIEAHPEDTLADVHPRLCEHNAVVVIGHSGEFQGIVTRKDAIRAIMDRKDWRSVLVRDVMTREVLHVPNHVTLAEAAKVMLEADIHQLVITGPPEGGAVAIGILTLQDVLRNAS